MTKEVEILDDEMNSRYEKIHGSNGLCHNLIELFNAMAEIRMMVEYGDYLAHTCTALKGNNMNDMKWKVDKLDWQAVAEEVRKEEGTLAEERREGLPISATPYLDDITKAAQRLGYEVSLVKYQIKAYADRNNFCHSGLKTMIQYGDFQQLAERLMEDKRSLELIFQGRPTEHIEMRKVIKIVEKEWFRSLWIDETRRERPMKWVLTEKGIAKMMSTEPARPNSR